MQIRINFEMDREKKAAAAAAANAMSFKGVEGRFQCLLLTESDNNDKFYREL